MSEKTETGTGTSVKLSPEEIARVKGLGCLKDKRYEDIFNIRVRKRSDHYDDPAEYGDSGGSI